MDYTITANDCKTPYPLAPLPVACCNLGVPKKSTQKQKEEEPMTEYNMEVDQRNHLKRRLDTAKCKMVETLQTKYRMHQIYPSTLSELKDAIKNGQLMPDPGYFDKDGKGRWGHTGTQALMFSDPARDEAGYDTAKAALDAAFTAAKDTIIVMPLADGLKALQAFEAATF